MIECWNLEYQVVDAMGLLVFGNMKAGAFESVLNSWKIHRNHTSNVFRTSKNSLKHEPILPASEKHLRGFTSDTGSD